MQPKQEGFPGIQPKSETFSSPYQSTSPPVIESFPSPPLPQSISKQQQNPIDSLIEIVLIDSLHEYYSCHPEIPHQASSFTLPQKPEHIHSPSQPSAPPSTLSQKGEPPVYTRKIVKSLDEAIVDSSIEAGLDEYYRSHPDIPRPRTIEEVKQAVASITPTRSHESVLLNDNFNSSSPIKAQRMSIPASRPPKIPSTAKGVQQRQQQQNVPDKRTIDEILADEAIKAGLQQFYCVHPEEKPRSMDPEVPIAVPEAATIKDTLPHPQPKFKSIMEVENELIDNVLTDSLAQYYRLHPEQHHQ
ncbi:hypothetical protein TRFO_33180 [Tritrichomonas foetus]|uniref:Uncharacterized protein n=1 Tax=Tritrichomonas foetus TaxID=1144522 RepID=A0A1J4JM47_9EUKA|nr:hypothetical protein TRFO_33180 [Tritrichomonas foetus]|eukprot:OHT00193.1 hypothetical protein TRFO_33180 [Tritrichomonas foetus]